MQDKDTHVETAEDLKVVTENEPTAEETEDLLLKHANVISVNENNSDRNLKTALNLFKTRYIRKILEENDWNQTETAKALDIQRTYLSRLIKEFSIFKQP